MEEFQKYNFKQKKCFLKKRYLLISEIGIGSYSVVYIGFDLKTKQYFAIKIFDNDSLQEGKFENKLYHKMNHPNIIKVIDFFIIDITIQNILYKYYVLVFPLKNNNIKFINNKIFNLWMRNIIDSILYLHTKMKICHTDIKPENFVTNSFLKNHLSIISNYNKYIYLFEDIKFQNIEKTHNHILEFIYFKDYYNTDTDTDTDTYINTNTDTDTDTDDYESSNSVYSTKTNTDTETDTDTDTDTLFNHLHEVKIIENKINNKNDNILFLIDLGSAQKINDLNIKRKYKLVQTRYYRAPEIILGLPYNEKIDIWSIGCTLFEIYTGEILFNPRSSEVFRSDHHHLYLISKVCSKKIPIYMINKSSKKDKLFMKDYKIKYESLFPQFSFKMDNFIQNKKLINIINSCLEIEPNKRISIEQLSKML